MNNSDYTGSNSEHTYSLQADFITKSSASIRIEQRKRRQALRRRTSLAALICIAVIIASLSAVIVEAADSNSSASASDTRYYTSITIERMTLYGALPAYMRRKVLTQAAMLMISAGLTIFTMIP